MSDIAPVGRSSVSPIARNTRNVLPGQAAATDVNRTDKVELSRASQLLSRLSELPDVRSELVDRVKAEIQAGTYETPEKIDALIDELAADL